MYAEQEHRPTESTSKDEDVTGSYQLMQQHVKQSIVEEIASLQEQLSKLLMISQLHIYWVIINVTNMPQWWTFSLLFGPSVLHAKNFFLRFYPVKFYWVKSLSSSTTFTQSCIRVGGMAVIHAALLSTVPVAKMKFLRWTITLMFSNFCNCAKKITRSLNEHEKLIGTHDKHSLLSVSMVNTKEWRCQCEPDLIKRLLCLCTPNELSQE